MFKPVWDVIKALRAHDEELGEQLDELRRELGRRGGRASAPGQDSRSTFRRRSAIDFARAFDARLVEQTTASWEFWFGMLEGFVADHGPCPRSPVPQGRWLPAWRVGHQATCQALTRGILD